MVLQGDVAALKTLNKDGIWVDVPPKPNTFICDVGSYLESHKRQVRRHRAPCAQQVRTGAVFSALLPHSGSRRDSGSPGLLRRGRQETELRAFAGG